MTGTSDQKRVRRRENGVLFRSKLPNQIQPQNDCRTFPGRTRQNGTLQSRTNRSRTNRSRTNRNGTLLGRTGPDLTEVTFRPRSAEIGALVQTLDRDFEMLRMKR